MSPVTCPNEGELTQYCLGALSSEQIEVVSEHVEHCTACSDRLTNLIRRSDPLAEAIRQAGHVEPFAAAPTAPPTTLRDYRIEDILGEGGMGAVYRAMHTRLGRPVALKLLIARRRLDPDAGARFEREMKAIGALRHPNIVQATDAGEVDGVPFLVMELLNGRDLGRLVQERGPLPVQEACDAIRQAALGLQHAHEHCLVHRDVKPSNLMLTPDGTVKVLDLGLARVSSGGDSASGSPETTIAGMSELTDEHTRVGTDRFMAPEQRDAPEQVGPAADVFALGRTLSFLLTGSPDVPKDETLPAELLETLERMQAPRIADRIPTAQAAADALAPFCGSRPSEVQHRRVWPLLVLASSLLIGGTLVAMTLNRKREPDPSGDGGQAPAAELPKKEPRKLGQLGMTSDAAVALQKVTADDLGIEPFTENSSGMRFAVIPAGELNIGPVTHVRLNKPYLLGVTEVTRAQFRAFVDAAGHQTAAEKKKNGSYLWYVAKDKLSGGSRSQVSPLYNWRNPGYPNPTDDEPVTQVSWFDAAAYCEHLSKIEKKKYRLPTLSELMWAARAGNTASFPGSTELVLNAALMEEYEVTPNRSPKQPLSVGKLKRNVWGLYDAVGNVGEWVEDWWGEFPGGTFANYVGPPSGQQLRRKYGGSYVLRGGFDQHGAMPPDWSNSTTGFRVVREP